ncbi:hypothetical protein BOVA711_4246 [Bacteroides ovatus]|nr:hypothetical protein BOVA711_4246 [Bacteroides ovatus]CAG9907173.1 hypothetical protein BOVAC16_162 [Bacteroides ovatus]
MFLFDYSIPVVYYNQIKATISLYIVKRKVYLWLDIDGGTLPYISEMTIKA